MNKRILIDATIVDITKPSGGAACVRAYIEALLVLFPGLIDVTHPEEAHIIDSRYNTIHVSQRKPLEKIMGLANGRIHRGASVIIEHLKLHPHEYEYVFLNGGLQSYSILKAIKSLPITSIVLHHNFEAEYQKDSLSWISLKGKTDLFVHYLEKRAYRYATINLFLTQQDMKLFEKTYGDRKNNYVTGVFEPDHTRTSLHSTWEKSAVITCSLGAEQNKRPILRFVKNYYAIFNKVLPDWELNIMGRSPSQEILELGETYPFITIYPNPKNIIELSSKSAIYICPMDAGGGVKLRIMDGLRAGQPIIVHERSARGYDAFIGEPFFQTYNNSESFTEGLEALKAFLQAHHNHRQIIQDTYYKSFSLEYGIESLRNIFKSAVLHK